MSNTNKTKMDIIHEICDAESIGCRSLNKAGLVFDLMEMVGMDTDGIIISEIPVDWAEQVVAVFEFDGDWYEFAAGISADGSGKYFEEVRRWSEGGDGELIPFEFFNPDAPVDVYDDGFNGLEQKYGVKVVGNDDCSLFDMYDAGGDLWFTSLTRAEIKRDCEKFADTLARIKESVERLKRSNREIEGESKRDRVARILEENEVWACEVWDVIPLPVVAVEITNGDWKHDHIRADYVLKECGFTLMKTEITEEDGSDCYSAIHYYA